MRFTRISNEQAMADGLGYFAIDEVPLPKRATEHSAGYDFCNGSNQKVFIQPGETIKIPTGIRAIMDDGFVLMMYVRSSVGIKKNLMLANGTGVIDADYWQAKNEGHIWIVLHNYGTEIQEIDAYERIAQGVFIPFVDCGEIVEEKRVGGIGSTNR